MTDDQEKLDEAISKACPKCRAGHKPRWRGNPSPGEYVHDYAVPQGGGVSSFSTVVCGASKIRRFGLRAAG